MRVQKFRAAKFLASLLLCLGLLALANVTMKKSQAASQDPNLIAASEELLADDGTIETAISGNNAIAVNRLTPTSYPATLQTIRLTFPQVQGFPSPIGSQVTLIAFVGAAGTTTPPANPTLLVNQVVTIPAPTGSNGFIDFPIQNGPTITAGDFYVGFKTPNPFGGVVFAVDSNGSQRQRAFVSVNNGVSFTGPVTSDTTGAPINLLLRAVVMNDAQPTARISVPASFNFSSSNIGVAQQQSLPITNTGGAALTITSITANNAQFALVSPSLPLTIAAGSQTPVVLRFTPASAGAQNATLTIASNDPTASSTSVALSGFGGSPTGPATVYINSNAATSGSIPAPTTPGSGILFGTQYAIFVPAGVTQLKLDLTGTQDVDLFARFNQRVTLSGGTVQADHSSTNGSTFPETIIITPGGSPALQTGLYYIAIGNYGPGAANFTLTATMTGAVPGSVATVSAASFLGTEASAEQISAFFGTNLATGTQVATTLPLPTTLLGTTVKVRDSAGTERSAPLFFVAPTQVNALIPTGTAAGIAQIVITGSDGKVSVGTILISGVAPGLFAANANGAGVAAATALRVRADNSQSFEPVSSFDAGQSRFVSVPIDLGPASDQVFLILNGTGIRGRSALTAVTATIGGVAAPVIFAGPQGDFVGLDQINVGIPRSLIGRNEVDVVLIVDGKTANTVKVNIK